MTRVLTVFGTRPEAIKLAPVLGLLRRERGMRSMVCDTAQHREMLEDVLRLFSIRPDFDLGVMRPGQSLGDLAGRLLRRLPPVLDAARPDVVLVQGDTLSTLAAAVAAFQKGIPVAHVEAGLRSHDLTEPLPEELNRRVTDLVADLHFAPTPGNAANLRREGMPSSGIVVTGNTVIDALRQARSSARSRPRSWWRRRLGTRSDALLDPAKKLILVTGHRRENFGPGLSRVCAALKTLGRARRDLLIAYPVHLNPCVAGPVRSLLAGASNIVLTGPLGYETFVMLMDRSRLILTDSGGIQEEAPALGKPVLVMRRRSERPELLRAGGGLVVGTDPARIVSESLRLLDDKAHYRRMSRVRHPFGEGGAAKRIVAALRKRFT